MAVSAFHIAAGFSLAGTLTFVMVPAFLRDFRSSRFAEPLDGLAHLAARASALAAGAPIERAYPGSAPLSPARVPAGAPESDPPGTWDHPTWRLLDYRLTEEHYFAFQFDSEIRNGNAYFVATAYGDLDADGNCSEFSVSGETKADGVPVVYAPQIFREVE
jgi:hypothetical protein